MSKIVKTGHTYNTPVQEIYCDTEQEFEQIISQYNLPIGSKVLIISEVKTMIKDGENHWSKYEGTSGGSGATIPEARGRYF